MLRSRDVRFGRHVGTAVSLVQTLVRWRQEREPIEVVLVVDFDAPGQARSWVAGHNQADQHAVDVDLIAIGRRATAHAPTVWKHRINGGVERDDVTGRAIGDWNRPTEVDGVDDVDAGALQGCYRGGWNAKRRVDAE